MNIEKKALTPTTGTKATSKTRRNNNTNHRSPDTGWLAHEYAAMMADIANAHGHIQHRTTLHYQAAGGDK